MPHPSHTSVFDYSQLVNYIVGRPHSCVQELFEIVETAAPELRFSEGTWPATEQLFRSVSRAAVERQSVVTIRDRFLGTTALFNPLRAHRTPRQTGPDPQDLFDQEHPTSACQFCRESASGPIEDEFGLATAADTRFVAGANRARLAAISGLVLGRCQEAHSHLRLSKSSFVSMCEAAWEYMKRAHAWNSAIVNFTCFWNAGSKAAGSVPHAHFQVAGTTEALGYLRAWRTAPASHLSKLRTAHAEVGLDLSRGNSVGWVSLCPRRDREVVICSESLVDGAPFVFDTIRALIEHGTNCFSLAMFVSPAMFGRSDPLDDGLPPVLWRLADRGDVRVRHSDVGSLELFGDVWVVSESPWAVHQWLARSLGPTVTE